MKADDGEDNITAEALCDLPLVVKPSYVYESPQSPPSLTYINISCRDTLESSVLFSLSYLVYSVLRSKAADCC